MYLFENITHTLYKHFESFSEMEKVALKMNSLFPMNISIIRLIKCFKQHGTAKTRPYM